MNDKIIYTLKLDGAQDYLSYNETLYNILCLGKLSPFRDCDRLRFRFYHSGAAQNMYLYDLAMACYMERVRPDTFWRDIRDFSEYKSRYCLEIDHLDNHTSNNTRLNLSLMPRACNRSKSDITARVQKPSMLICCYTDGEYRVHYEHCNTQSDMMIGDINSVLERSGMPLITYYEPSTAAMDFICEDAESFLSCVNAVADRKIAYKVMESISPMRKAGKWVAAKEGCYTDNVNMSIECQELLAARDKATFQRWNG